MSEPRYVEATGPDVETAIKNGLNRLGVSSKDVIVEVIEEANRGLFGIGGRPARVRLTLLRPPEPPKAKPKPATPPPARKPQPEAPVTVEDTAAPVEAVSDAAPADDTAAAQSAPAVAETEQEAPSGERKPRKRRPRRRKKSSAQRREAQDAQAQPDTAEDSGSDDDASPLAITYTPAPADDEEANVAVETVQELLDKMGVTASVEASYASPADENESGPLVLQVTGKDLGMLIGRRGETLASLQYITRLIVSRDLQRRVDLVVDVEHYKARREQRLHSLALRMAKQASQRGRTVKLEPMPAYERRIIHLSLRDRTDVYTQSEGEGDSRKVTIVPVRDRE